MKRSTLNRVIFSLFLLFASILAFTKIVEPDTWLHLSMGRLIHDLKGLPQHEMFTYPNQDLPFAYSSWLFGLMSYLIYMASDGGLVLFKTACIVLVAFLLLGDALRPYRNYPVAVLVVGAALLFSQDRFVVRPEIVGLACLSFSIFSLNAYLYEGRKYLYALPFVHLVWANSHSSIILMFIPFGAFLAAAVLQPVLAARNAPTGAPISRDRAATVAALFALSFCAALISPYHIGQFSFGGGLLATDWYKNNIYELRPPEGAFRALLAALDGIVLLSFALDRKRFSVFHFLLVLPFMMMPFIAVRFAYLFALVAAPVVSRNLSSAVSHVGWDGFFHKAAVRAGAIVLIIASTVLSLLHIEPFGLSYGQFGPGFIEEYEPGKALAYMDRNGIDGRVMNSFYFGQYIIWKSYPRRTVFIDGRGYLSPDLLYKSQQFLWSNPVLDDLEQQYGFRSILIAYPEKMDGGAAMSDYDEGFFHPGWALVYWDDISMLFVKRSEEFNTLIARDEYRVIRPDLIVSYFVRNHVTKKNRDSAIRELQRNMAETHSRKAYRLLSVVSQYEPTR